MCRLAFANHVHDDLDTCNVMAADAERFESEHRRVALKNLAVVRSQFFEGI